MENFQAEKSILIDTGVHGCIFLQTKRHEIKVQRFDIRNYIIFSFVIFFCLSLCYPLSTINNAYCPTLHIYIKHITPFLLVTLFMLFLFSLQYNEISLNEY